MTEENKDHHAELAAGVNDTGRSETETASGRVYGAVHEELMKLRVKLHNVLNGRSDIDNIVYHAQNRACDAAATVVKPLDNAMDALREIHMECLDEGHTDSGEMGDPCGQRGQVIRCGICVALDSVRKVLAGNQATTEVSSQTAASALKTSLRSGEK